VDREERPARVNAAIERVHLARRAGHRPMELSGASSSVSRWHGRW
jgi:ABC-type nitrate/sulfonate/bicarbonate transport system ATPase subunit